MTPTIMKAILAKVYGVPTDTPAHMLALIVELDKKCEVVATGQDTDLDNFTWLAERTHQMNMEALLGVSETLNP
jgi:hypothetical protein